MKIALAFANIEPTPATDRERVVHLEARIVVLEAELVAARRYAPQRPPAGWKRVKEVAATAHLSEVAIYKMAQQGRCASTKIRDCLWIHPNTVRRGRAKV
jgi:hypothetical protein